MLSLYLAPGSWVNGLRSGLIRSAGAKPRDKEGKRRRKVKFKTKLKLKETKTGRTGEYGGPSRLRLTREIS